MATVKKIPAETKVVVVTPEQFTLTLSNDEASFLAALVGRTVGDLGYSIYAGLEDAGADADKFRVRIGSNGTSLTSLNSNIHLVDENERTV